ncbi:coenzyme PQQ synthesis protein D (PqqD) [Lachnotalea glycerini]|uniref:Coenzyme PQQ synthesis protein D (PqqD) n=1 Tax=Lachnotalea glycerini TaxID=1763509 RepID=A0A255I4B5_9FIRM|nr:PqqD family protein [Lachnotalea glycerini]PXV93716.1 coenzyme PQQ synthesis protein D (PqqD) [Lachnotalea glycerini]RDY32658.1 PqqD family protein [Lachnotalea glycerini]
MDMSKIPILKTIAWKVSDGYVVIDSYKGQLMLNETSSLIWKEIDGNKTIAKIIEELYEKYKDNNNKDYIEEIVYDAINEFEGYDLVMLNLEDDMDGWLQYE